MTRIVPATLAGEWALLHESLAHAPRLPPSLFGALARCLAVAAREERRLRPPLLVYGQKHLLAPPAAADRRVASEEEEGEARSPRPSRRADMISASAPQP